MNKFPPFSVYAYICYNLIQIRENREICKMNDSKDCTKFVIFSDVVIRHRHYALIRQQNVNVRINDKSVLFYT